jgi:hypothetical protein
VEPGRRQRQVYRGSQVRPPGTILKSAIESDRVARSRNVIEKPDQKNVKDWKGFSELGWTDDPAKYTAAVKKPQLAQGETFDEGMFTSTVKAAHGLKLAPWQVEGLVAEQHKALNKEIADRNAKGAKEVADLTRRCAASGAPTSTPRKPRPSAA